MDAYLIQIKILCKYTFSHRRKLLVPRTVTFETLYKVVNVRSPRMYSLLSLYHEVKRPRRLCLPGATINLYPLLTLVNLAMKWTTPYFVASLQWLMLSFHKNDTLRIYSVIGGTYSWR